ncbi:cytochrome c [bacterium]|nr:cytochrome c [bacterium]
MARTFFATMAVALLLSGCSKDPMLVSGQDVFTKYCATCHQQDGKGISGAFPSLYDSEWVSGDKGRLIRLVLRGMQGPIVVKGETYNNVMTPHSFLTDEQVASVLTFVRQEFDNDADKVEAGEVAVVRASLTSDELYIASELENLLGIPSLEIPE